MIFSSAGEMPACWANCSGVRAQAVGRAAVQLALKGQNGVMPVIVRSGDPGEAEDVVQQAWLRMHRTDAEIVGDTAQPLFAENVRAIPEHLTAVDPADIELPLGGGGLRSPGAEVIHQAVRAGILLGC